MNLLPPFLLAILVILNWPLYRAYAGIIFGNKDGLPNAFTTKLQKIKRIYEIGDRQRFPEDFIVIFLGLHRL